MVGGGADVPLFPGCNAWGCTREEALQEVAQAFVEIMLEDGDSLPEEASVSSLRSQKGLWPIR